MKKLFKLISVVFILFSLSGCDELGLIEIPKFMSDKKWGNSRDGSRFTMVEDLRVHYRDQGPRNAPVIIAIHGIADSLHVWDKMAQKLQKDFRFIRFDVPGFGLTGAIPNRDYSAENWVHIINEFTKKLRLKNFHIIGNSLGGYLAWNYAIENPHKTKSIFLLDPAAFPVDKAPWVVELARYSPVRQISLNTTPKLLIAKAVYEVYGDDSLVTKETIDRYYEMMLRKGNRHSYMDVFRKILELQTIYPTELADLKTKTMVVFGEKDEWIPPTQLAMWKKDVPHVLTNTYPGVGHTPQDEAAELVINDFLNFIKTK